LSVDLIFDTFSLSDNICLRRQADPVGVAPGATASAEVDSPTYKRPNICNDIMPDASCSIEY